MMAIVQDATDFVPYVAQSPGPWCQRRGESCQKTCNIHNNPLTNDQEVSVFSSSLAPESWSPNISDKSPFVGAVSTGSSSQHRGAGGSALKPPASASQSPVVGVIRG